MPFCSRILRVRSCYESDDIVLSVRYTQTKFKRTHTAGENAVIYIGISYIIWIGIRVSHNNNSAGKGNYATVAAIVIRRCIYYYNTIMYNIRLVVSSADIITGCLRVGRTRNLQYERLACARARGRLKIFLVLARCTHAHAHDVHALHMHVMQARRPGSTRIHVIRRR